nr:hypothetical protein [uncultured bacterium]
MAVELRNRLRSQLGLDVPLVTFMQDASIAQLAAEISLRLEQAEAGSDRKADGAAVQSPQASELPPTSGPDAEPLLARLDQLTDEEVDALLGAALAESARQPVPAVGAGANAKR